jgi:hypothetical protein
VQHHRKEPIIRLGFHQPCAARLEKQLKQLECVAAVRRRDIEL